ncbi:MAG: alpha/beta hydrolase [Elainellaceae cyanobacterium]
MTIFPDVLWLSTSLSFQRFNRPAMSLLSQKMLVAQWEYGQSPDEANCLETAIALLHDYLQQGDRPIHLVGHSTSGLLALLYACKYPERVRSLTLLAVGVNPAIDWQAHFYAVRQLLPCDRQKILLQMVHNLFGYCAWSRSQSLVRYLEQDLACSLSIHSLLKRAEMGSMMPDVPLLVCGSKDDVIVDPTQVRGWSRLLKRGDRVWIGSEGRHFFHYFRPEETVSQMHGFWDSISVKESQSPTDQEQSDQEQSDQSQADQSQLDQSQSSQNQSSQSPTDRNQTVYS